MESLSNGNRYEKIHISEWIDSDKNFSNYKISKKKK